MDVGVGVGVGEGCGGDNVLCIRGGDDDDEGIGNDGQGKEAARVINCMTFCILVLKNHKNHQNNKINDTMCVRACLGHFGV